MACGCKKNQTQYEVVTKATEEKPEKVVWRGASEPIAKNVAKRYSGSKIREKAKPGAANTAK